jgi:Thioredoxin
MRTLILALMLVAGGVQAAPQADPVGMFDAGMTWEQFLAGARAQRTLWLMNAGRASVAPETVERFRRATDGLKLLVIAEAACSDSVNTVPYLAKLATLAGVDMRVVGRSTGLPLMDAHRTPDGRTATPTVILLRDGRDVGAWVERPAALQEWYLSKADLGQQDRLDRKMAWYDWDRGASTIREIVALAERRN